MKKLHILFAIALLSLGFASTASARGIKTSSETFEFGTLLPNSGTKGIVSAPIDFATLTVTKETKHTRNHQTVVYDLYKLTVNKDFSSFGKEASIVGVDIYNPLLGNNPDNYHDYSILISGLNLDYSSKHPKSDTVTWKSSYENITPKSIFAADVAGIQLVSPISHGSKISDGSPFCNTNPGTGSGLYKSTYVSPVPEPTEGALLLSGIGLLGFIASRRKKDSSNMPMAA